MEGAGHRDILQKPACIAAVLSECCSHPSHYVRIRLDGISAVQHGTNRSLVLEMTWGDEVRMSTEAIQTKGGGNNSSGARNRGDDRRPFKEERFTLGITQRDIDQSKSLIVRPLKSLDDILTGAAPVKISVTALLDGSVPKVLNFGTSHIVSLFWDLKCEKADRYGAPGLPENGAAAGSHLVDERIVGNH